MSWVLIAITLVAGRVETVAVVDAYESEAACGKVLLEMVDAGSPQDTVWCLPVGTQQ